MNATKPILCLDFDGVCHQYTSGWQGADVIPDPPVPGLWKFLTEASLYFDIAVFSSRSHQEGGIAAMRKFFAQVLIAWTNGEDDDCCVYPIGLTTCGYKAHECMHTGSASSVVPVNGRHEFVSSKVDRCLEPISEEKALEAVEELLSFPHTKPPAFISIDDRCLLFTGEWPSVQSLREFKPWNKKGV